MKGNYKNQLDSRRINVDKEISRMKARLERLSPQKLSVDAEFCEVEDTNEISINVVSSMNTGKSTFVNALLQQKLMPTANQVCTAKLIKVIDSDTSEYSMQAFNEADRVIDERDLITYDELSALNDDDSVAYIELTGTVPFAKNVEAGISIIDTAGANNSRSTIKNTFEVLESGRGIIVCLLDANQFKFADNDFLLRFIANDPSTLRRTVFVINKLDQINLSQINLREKPVEKVYMDAKEYLLSMGISTKDIYPISALTALDIRTILNRSELDMDDDKIYDAMAQVRKFNRNIELHLEKYTSVSEKIKAKIDLELKNAVANGDRNKQALIHSGIPTVEARLVELANELANK